MQTPWIAPSILSADFAALVIGMDRTDLLKKVGKPSMSMSSVESSQAVETCWYKSGADSVTVILRDGKVAELVAAKRPTIPSMMGEEKAANPFLRADVPAVAKSLGLAGKPAWQVFAEMRERKNKF